MSYIYSCLLHFTHPMSSIRSASSRIRHRTCDKLTIPLSIISISRPGVATMMSQPKDRSLNCCRMSEPPYNTRARRLDRKQSLRHSRWIWEASSRVGARMTARGCTPCSLTLLSYLLCRQRRVGYIVVLFIGSWNTKLKCISLKYGVWILHSNERAVLAVLCVPLLGATRLLLFLLPLLLRRPGSNLFLSEFRQRDHHGQQEGTSFTTPLYIPL